MKTKKFNFIAVIFILSIVLSSCAIQRPEYKPGTDKDKYNKELVKYYEKVQKKSK